MDQETTPAWLERVNRLALTSALLSTTVLEVNNALQVISGSAEMLNPASTPDVIAKRGEAIGAHARRASALLAELSAFARDESTHAAALDVGRVAQRALTMRQYTLAKLKIDSSFESSGETRTVIANQRLFLQIVLNLLVNAEQALGAKGGGRILVSVRSDGRNVVLSIEDDGAGIPADRVPRLFTVDPSSNVRLGIGLAVARELARRYGGDLVYSPRPGGGSQFSLTMPAAS